MTRGLVPPDTLTKDDIRTLGDVRRDIWTNAAVGGGESIRTRDLQKICLQLNDLADMCSHGFLLLLPFHRIRGRNRISHPYWS